jgi:UDP-2,3-diacylglucosamine pyrophosphatase LpxH
MLADKMKKCSRWLILGLAMLQLSTGVAAAAGSVPEAVVPAQAALQPKTVLRTERQSKPSSFWKQASSRNKIVVVSDLHLNQDDKLGIDVKNRPLLIKFLQWLKKTGDVRELVINGDFLDEWNLPFSAPAYPSSKVIYRQIIAHNQPVFQALQDLMASGVKLVYVPGNHDMLLDGQVLAKALPGVVQARDARGLGAYYTGDRREIVIEHGHRYDAFCAPDTVTNRDLAGNGNTILPPAYFHARILAGWNQEGNPKLTKTLPLVTTPPSSSNIDQLGAYYYYQCLLVQLQRITPREDPAAKLVTLHIAGLNGSYSVLDILPVQQKDGTISSPVLFKNFQRTWEEREEANRVKVKNNPGGFIEALMESSNPQYYYQQAQRQYLANPREQVEVVVFGHTHIPDWRKAGPGRFYANTGTWLDDNWDYPAATRTFVVITTGKVDNVAVYKYNPDDTVTDISEKLG